MCSRRWKIFVFIETLIFIVPSRRRFRSTFIRRNSRVLFGFTYFESQAYSSNVKILPVLLSMIILSTEREDFRRINENDLDIDGRERIEFIAPEIRDLFRFPGIRLVAQRTGIFGTQKNRLLISQSIASRAYSTARYCSIPPRRVSSCEISFRGFT